MESLQEMKVEITIDTNKRTEHQVFVMGDDEGIDDVMERAEAWVRNVRESF